MKVCKIKLVLKSDILLCLRVFVAVANKQKESMGIASYCPEYSGCLCTSVCYLYSSDTYLLECLIPSYLDMA
jgi:hypothetical protein